MTREELLARFDGHEAFATEWTPFVKEQLALVEDDGGWVGTGKDPGASRRDKQGEREALCNEAEVRLERIPHNCQLGRRAVDDGDGDKALAYEHLAMHD